MQSSLKFAHSHYFNATTLFDLWHEAAFQLDAICISSLGLIFLRTSPRFGGCLPRFRSDTDLILPHLLHSHLGPVGSHNCLSLVVYRLSFQLCDCRRDPCNLCQSSLLIATPSGTSTKTHDFSGTFSWASMNVFTNWNWQVAWNIVAALHYAT